LPYLVRGLDDFIRGTIDARKEAARVAGFNEENSRNFEAVADQLLRVFDIVNLDAETLSRRVGEIAEDFGATVGEVLNVATNLADVDVEQRRILNALILENAQREDAARLTAEQNALAEQAAESAERRAEERNAFLAEQARIAEEEAQREAEARERAAEEAAQAELEALRKTQEAALQGYEDVNQAAEDSRLVRAQVEEELANGIGETVEELKATWRDYANSVTGLISAVSSIFDAQNAAEIEALRERGATDEEIAAKELEIAREQAKRKKATGIFNVGISTAEAIAEASPNPFLIGLAIATGAAQLAAIAATPLPTAQFGGSFMVPPGNEADSWFGAGQSG
jgi:DNA repair exonuclease SbcCD ATPase subunit